MRKQFEDQLSHLHEDLIQMGILIEKALGQVIDILKKPTQELAESIKEFETQVDQYERGIQSQALRILFTQQPVAGDLRSISTALHIITDMERIADQACDIAEIAMLLGDELNPVQPEHIPAMVQCSIKMVTGSVDAFVTQNLVLAREVIAADDEVDDLFMQVRDELIEQITQNRESAARAIDFVMIAKYIERIADHAVNIAEWVIFNITGEHKNEKLL